MDSLVGYGSDEDNDSERCPQAWGAVGGSRRRDDDTNYDTVNMDMSEESHDEESEPELPPAEPSEEQRHSHDNKRSFEDNRDRHRDNDRDRDRQRARNDDRRDRRRDSPARTRSEKDKADRDNRADRRSPRRDDKYNRSERWERNRGYEGTSRDGRRGLLGDRPDERSLDAGKMPALMDLKPFGGEAPPGFVRATDTRDAVSPRFTERDRRDREKERERDRDRHSRRSEERRCSRDQGRSEHRSRSRGAPSSHGSSSNERRGSPSSGDYRPSSYKVNKKLEVMEKMGLQIKTPDGSMATAQQLRAAAHEPTGLPAYCNPAAGGTRILDQVQKRKLLWSNKNKSEAEEAAKWSGTKFAQDTDGKQVSKFMRLMGIKEPAAVKPEPTSATADPNKKQEELFQAMQAQYEVARATTHTMRGVGLGFQRGPF
ncbi:uncharacterized protein [Epargyreus clarus]|uniref:uncharacterized protein isoform X2 n=1 Tax=Epargyreus clarus TaxID=520877 RepID=UPI003C2C9554